LSGSDAIIHARHLGLPSDNGTGPSETRFAFDHEPTLEEVRGYYLKMLQVKYSGHRAKLAGALGISERNLYRLLQRYGLE
jgi:DNA-binding NtrC family response regulator